MNPIGSNVHFGPSLRAGLRLASGKWELSFALHWVLVCFAIPAIVVAPNATQLNILTLLPWLTILYSGTRLASIAALGANRIVELTFWLYAYIFLGLSAILQTAAQKYPWLDHYTDYEVFRAHILVLSGMLAFDVGYRGRWSRGRARSGSAQHKFVLTPGRILVVGAATLVACAFATLKLGLATLFLNRTDRFDLLSDSYDVMQMSIYTGLARTVPFALLIIALAYRQHHNRCRIALNALIAVFLAVTLIENNPIATARYQVGTVLLSIFFVFPWRPVKAKIAIYGLIVGLVIVFPYADMFRTTNNASLSVQLEKFQDSPPIATKVDYDSFQQVMNGMRMVDRNGFQAGAQMLGVALFWVPRSIWTDKAEPTGALIAKDSGYSFTNLSAPLWIEFYVDGGWPWLIVGMFLYGAFVRRLDFSRQRPPLTTPGFLIATIFSGYQIFLLRGALLPTFVYLAPIFPAIYFCTTARFRRKRPSLGGPSTRAPSAALRLCSSVNE